MDEIKNYKNNLVHLFVCLESKKPTEIHLCSNFNNSIRFSSLEEMKATINFLNQIYFELKGESSE